MKYKSSYSGSFWSNLACWVAFHDIITPGLYSNLCLQIRNNVVCFPLLKKKKRKESGWTGVNSGWPAVLWRWGGRGRKKAVTPKQRTRVIPGILLHTISIPEWTLSQTDKAAIRAYLFERSASLLKVPYSCKMHLTNVFLKKKMNLSRIFFLKKSILYFGNTELSLQTKS